MYIQDYTRQAGSLGYTRTGLSDREEHREAPVTRSFDSCTRLTYQPRNTEGLLTLEKLSAMGGQKSCHGRKTSHRRTCILLDMETGEEKSFESITELTNALDARYQSIHESLQTGKRLPGPKLLFAYYSDKFPGKEKLEEVRLQPEWGKRASIKVK